jgi:hypothetical protein
MCLPLLSKGRLLSICIYPLISHDNQIITKIKVFIATLKTNPSNTSMYASPRMYQRHLSFKQSFEKSHCIVTALQKHNHGHLLSSQVAAVAISSQNHTKEASKHHTCAKQALK